MSISVVRFTWLIPTTTASRSLTAATPTSLRSASPAKRGRPRPFLADPGCCHRQPGQYLCSGCMINHRVQVFDSTGAYLTTIGGQAGSNSSQFRVVNGVDFDQDGSLYITDRDTHRIQVFTPGVPDWQQVNINGFGKRRNTNITNMEIFKEQLYVGTASWWDDGGAEVWRTSNGETWEQVNQTGFGESNLDANAALTDFAVFNDQLYASTGWRDQPGQIWRSPDGTTWTQIVSDGFGNENNDLVTRFVVFNDYLYASTGNSENGTGNLAQRHWRYWIVGKCCAWWKWEF